MRWFSGRVGCAEAGASTGALGEQRAVAAQVLSHLSRERGDDGGCGAWSWLYGVNQSDALIANPQSLETELWQLCFAVRVSPSVYIKSNFKLGAPACWQSSSRCSRTEGGHRAAWRTDCVLRWSPRRCLSSAGLMELSMGVRAESQYSHRS